MIITSDGSSNFKPVPPGLHLARCFQYLDIGTRQSEYEGKVKFSRKLKVVWEIHSENEDGEPIQTEDGEPMTISKDYTKSWNEKATLRLDLQAWRGRPFTDEESRGFELSNILGQWCMLNIIHRPKTNGKDGVYTNIAGLAPVPSALRKTGLPEAFHKTSCFDLDAPDMTVFGQLPGWQQGLIKDSPEWAAIGRTKEPAAAGGGFDDIESDIPF